MLNTMLTHMPFLMYDKDHRRVLFLTQADDDAVTQNIPAVWKLYVSIDRKEPQRIETGLPEQNIECSPTAWQDDAGWHLSFIGQDERDVYRLYRMDGKMLQQLSKPVSMRMARTGFVYQDRLAVGEIQDIVHIHDNNGDHKIEIPGTFLYRVSYRADHPNKILISGDWIGEHEEPFTIEYDLDTDLQRYLEIETENGTIAGAYKPTIYGNEIIVAEKTGKLFEHRRLRNKEQYHSVCCQMAHRHRDSVGANGLLVTKKCGCRKNKNDSVNENPARPSCLECVEKHLGAAFVIASEIHDGYAYHLRFIGHLHEAEEESQELLKLHKMIRSARKSYQQEGIIPDWESLAKIIHEVKNAP
jgi:hypothetical protein